MVILKSAMYIIKISYHTVISAIVIKVKIIGTIVFAHI